jgi:putative transposase
MTKTYKNLPKFDDNSYAHFITMNTYNNYPYFKDDELCQILREELEFYRKKYGFILIGYVIMPDHLHLLLWWDKEEKPNLSISKMMQVIKGATARRIIDLMQTKGLEQMLQSTPRNADSRSHRQKLKYCLWQPTFYDFSIYSEGKLLEKLNYIHGNPVKAGLASSPGDYKWSSYKDYFKEENQTFNEVLIGEHA